MVRWEIDGLPTALFSFPVAEQPFLTPTELQIALALLDAQSNEEIARARGTSRRTVDNQVAAIFGKLNVRSRGELVAAWSSYLRGFDEQR